MLTSDKNQWLQERIPDIVANRNLAVIGLHHTAHEHALVFGERRRLSPLVPTAIGRVSVRVLVRSIAPASAKLRTGRPVTSATAFLYSPLPSINNPPLRVNRPLAFCLIATKSQSAAAPMATPGPLSVFGAEVKIKTCRE